MRGTVSQHLRYLSSKGITGVLASAGTLVRKFRWIQLSSGAGIFSILSPAPPHFLDLYANCPERGYSA